MKMSNNKIGNIFLAKLEAFGNWLVKHAKIVMPLVLIACVAVTVTVSVNASRKDAGRQEDVEANSNLEETTDSTPAIPQVPLQKNTDPKIDELINTYYTASVNNDIDTIRTLVENLDDTEILRIQETSKYTEAYPTVDIYTKEGPTDKAVLIFVCTEVKFTDFEEPVPGMTSYYARIDENGDYCIVEECSESEANYIKVVSLQDDVVDMNNRVVAAYNDMIAANIELAEFLEDLGKEIKKNVGEVLVQTENEATGTETEAEEAAEAGTASDNTEAAEIEMVVTKVRAIDVVNIRSSDSETADKLGKAAIGDEFKLLEKIGNGWSKIEYEGSAAYIKSEFLEDIETEAASSAVTSTSTDNGQTPQASGTVTVKENVRIRSAASETSEKIGVAYAGDKLEVVMKRADGWTEIKYNGKSAYVKSDYVE